MYVENPLFLPISYTTLFLITFITYKIYKYYSYGLNPNLPPGKIGLPLIGESLEYLQHCWKGKPEKFFQERMVKYSNLSAFKTSLFGEPTIYLVGPSGNKFLFSNEDKLVTPWRPATVVKVIRTPFNTEVLKEERTKGRKVIQSLFTPESHNTFVPLMDGVTQKHFDTYWQHNTEVHVHDLTKRYTFELACRLFLSISDPKEVAELSEPFNDVIDGIISLPINLPGTPVSRAIKGAKKIEKKLIEIIKQRKIDLANNKASPTQDILAYMMSYKDDNGQPMREEGIPTNMIGLLLAGHDTTSGAITGVVKYLAEYPPVYDRVYKEQMEIANSKAPGELLNWKDMQKMKYSWNVAREAMRLLPPSPAVFREALQDIHYDGYIIPKGWKIFCSISTTHKSSQNYQEPEKFDPTRFEGRGPAPFTHIPFGEGTRICPGNECARLEILIFMHNLVKRFKFEKAFPLEDIYFSPFPVPTHGLKIRLNSNKYPN